jgi:hypothetical protein
MWIQSRKISPLMGTDNFRKKGYTQIRQKEKKICFSETPLNLLPDFQRVYIEEGVYLNRRKQERKNISEYL